MTDVSNLKFIKMKRFLLTVVAVIGVMSAYAQLTPNKIVVPDIEGYKTLIFTFIPYSRMHRYGLQFVFTRLFGRVWMLLLLQSISIPVIRRW